MGKKDKIESTGRAGLSRRDFFKASAAATAATGIGLDFAFTPATASATPTNISTLDSIATSTCPYCSAQCGQKVGVKGGAVVDIWGDPDSPTNRGGLCAKGAGAFQLATNPRRLGVPEHTAVNPLSDGKDMTGTAWKRVADGSFNPLPLEQAMYEIAHGDKYLAGGAPKWVGDPLVAGDNLHDGLKNIRGNLNANSNSSSVMFFGCSHANNEQNYLYRKLIANFGTTNTEHQARI